jgi:hypothetical protein
MLLPLTLWKARYFNIISVQRPYPNLQKLRAMQYANYVNLEQNYIVVTLRSVGIPKFVDKCDDFLLLAVPPTTFEHHITEGPTELHVNGEDGLFPRERANFANFQNRISGTKRNKTSDEDLRRLDNVNRGIS